MSKVYFDITVDHDEIGGRRTLYQAADIFLHGAAGPRRVGRSQMLSTMTISNSPAPSFLRCAAASGYSADSWQATAFSKLLDDDEAVEFLPAIVAERFAVVPRKQFGPCRTVFD